MEFLPCRRIALLILGPALCVPCLSGQTSVDEQTTLLATARSKTYNLRSAGVKSFHCDLDVDWPGVFRSVGQSLPEDNPVFKALHDARISIINDLDTGPKANWVDPQPVDPAIDKAIMPMRQGVQQMVEGFFTSWNPTCNGKLITMWPASFKATESGYLLDDSNRAATDLISFDKDLRVTHLSSKSDALAFEADTSFEPTVHGLMMSALKGDYRQPSTAPATHLDIAATFAPVGQYTLPATVTVTIPNVLVLKMRFMGCTVKPADSDEPANLPPGEKNQ